MNDTSLKILSVNDPAIDDLHDKSKRLVVCYGHFNVIHPGHMRYLKYARTLGDTLIVALQDDAALIKAGANNYFPQSERAEGISSLHIVDHVVILDHGHLSDFIMQVRPDVLVLGSEHEAKQDEQMDSAITVIEECGGRVVFHAGETHYATADLLYVGQDELEQEKINLFKKACRNQNIEIQSLNRRLEQIKNTSLLVIGDTIVDQYVACDALGMSAEAPVLVVRELESREFVGGAAIVASHIQALGAKCHYISVVGDDIYADLVHGELEKQGVKSYLVSDTSRPTTYKIRYMVENQKLFRVTKLKEHKLSATVESEIIKKINELAPQLDGILVSDFVYGVITSKILKTIQSVSREYGLKIFGDIQCSSQMGKVTKFKDFHLVFPTEREARYALDNVTDGIEWIANKLLDELSAGEVIVKLGSDGFIAYSKQTDEFVVRQHYPALSVNPVDVTGAGDSLLAAMSASISSGSSLMEASAIGACMAALAVREVGNLPISGEQLKNYMSKVCP
ncbi:MAG TPA: ADP-heptose synthase [Gammaproteobacteria bacterium]|nr:ADP-heptose synthase [Gammaproteobacteria bacterium]